MVESKYQIGQLLGKGIFEVFKCTRMSDGKQLAVKVINFTIEDRQKAKELARKEADLMRNHQHEYLIKCIDYQEDANACYIYMELAIEDLHQYISRFKIASRKIPEKVVYHIIFQILHGLNYLHKNNIIHRDIKPLNTLMIGLNCKLSDFGSSKELSNEISMAKTQAGTPYYASPEIIKGQKHTKLTDVWSFGVLLYELCTLKWPFNDPYKNQKDYKADYDEIYSQDTRDIIDYCLKVDPGERLSVEQILDLPVMKNFAKEFNIDAQDRINDHQMGLERRGVSVAASNSNLILRTTEFRRLQYFPAKESMAWENHIIGVRQYGKWTRFQFILSDNRVSNFAASKCTGNDGKEWNEHRIPDGKTISKVEMMILINDRQLYGLKFYDRDNTELLKVECQQSSHWEENKYQKLISVDLQNDERLVGVQSTGVDSTGVNYEKAYQCDFQFIIAKKSE